MKGRLLRVLLFAFMILVGFGAPKVDARHWKQHHKSAVKIIRDNFGVPHVYAKSVYGLFYGYGYSIATDRLFQMEMAKRTVLGTVSEVLGADYLDFDKKIRSNYWPASIKSQYESLRKKYKKIFEGYADGMNARIREVLKDQDDLLPKEFSDFDFLPEEWKPLDVVMVFVGTMANRFSDFNTELDNLAFLEYLNTLYDEETAWNIFNQTKWINDPGAPTTVPDKDLPHARSFSELSQVKIAHAKRKTILKQIQAERKGTYQEMELYKKVGLPILNRKALTSNFWAIGRKKNHGNGSILVNGPQFGWYNPGYVYEIGLHGAGFDLVGNTPFGYPAILFGHNRHIAWGSTAGLGDLVDIYEEQLNPGDKYQYFFKGEWREMEKRTDTIFVRDEDPVSLDIFRTLHGLVIKFDEDNNLAYSKKRTWEGHELESLIGWIESTKASGFGEWRKAAKKMALTINWYYADRAGNIGYIHTGKYPIRKPGHDWRFPVSGTGDMEWLGILPFKKNPQVFNPKQGYIANWNNKPAGYWNDPDMWWLLWGSADRVQPILDVLSSQKKFNKDEMWGLIKKMSYIDLNIAYFLPFMERAIEGLPPGAPEVQAVNLLRNWDRCRCDRDNDGFYDSSALTIMQKWLTLMLKNTLQDDIGAFFWRYSSTGYPMSPPHGSTNVQLGTKILYHALLGADSTVPNDYDFFNGEDPLEVVLRTLSQTISELAVEYGSDNMDSWLQPVVPQKFFVLNFAGIPQASQNEELSLPVNMNRGTENHMVVLKPMGFKGYDVCPPGESGFVAPDGTPDQHYDDQMDMYRDFGSKPMLFHFSDVINNAESVNIYRVNR